MSDTRGMLQAAPHLQRHGFGGLSRCFAEWLKLQVQVKPEAGLAQEEEAGLAQGKHTRSTAQLQFECSPLHRGAVDSFELAELLACRPIHANRRVLWSVCQ
jgi:hypothetical protein